MLQWLNSGHPVVELAALYGTPTWGVFRGKTGNIIDFGKIRCLLFLAPVEQQPESSPRKALQG